MTATEVETLYDIVSRGRVAFDGAGYYIRLEVNDRERLSSGLMKLMQEKRANAAPKQNVPYHIPDWVGKNVVFTDKLTELDKPF